MANSIIVTPMINGSRLGSYKVEIIGDGSGEETAFVLLTLPI